MSGIKRAINELEEEDTKAPAVPAPTAPPTPTVSFKQEESEDEDYRDALGSEEEEEEDYYYDLEEEEEIDTLGAEDTPYLDQELIHHVKDGVVELQEEFSEFAMDAPRPRRTAHSLTPGRRAGLRGAARNIPPLQHNAHALQPAQDADNPPPHTYPKCCMVYWDYEVEFANNQETETYCCYDINMPSGNLINDANCRVHPCGMYMSIF